MLGEKGDDCGGVAMIGSLSKEWLTFSKFNLERGSRLISKSQSGSFLRK